MLRKRKEEHFRMYLCHWHLRIITLSQTKKYSFIRSLRVSIQSIIAKMQNLHMTPPLSKGGFFSESAIRFSDLQISNIPKTILSLKFKLQAQDSFLEFFFEIWRSERISSHFMEKATVKRRYFHCRKMSKMHIVIHDFNINIKSASLITHNSSTRMALLFIF